jgi:SAM-dependent methyltransferase
MWYFFGLWIGLRNVMRNGARLGVRKTAGRILKPINSFSRFPEYHFFASGIEQFTRQCQPGGGRLSILDVGSPKPFGLYLAYKLNADVHLTDITRYNLDQDEVVWGAICSGAEGHARFELQDARALTYPNGTFDIVYAMSVVEHVEGELQDKAAVTEMMRVLKPGGLLLLSLPCGPYYIEQLIAGRPHLTDDARDTGLHFFQRIYDASALNTRVLPAITALADHVEVYTVFRRHYWLTRAYYEARAAISGYGNILLGLVNPIWSIFINQHTCGVYTGFSASYDTVFSLKDIYGDFVLVCRKRLA